MFALQTSFLNYLQVYHTNALTVAKKSNISECWTLKSLGIYHPRPNENGRKYFQLKQPIYLWWHEKLLVFIYVAIAQNIAYKLSIKSTSIMNWWHKCIIIDCCGENIYIVPRHVTAANSNFQSTNNVTLHRIQVFKNIIRCNVAIQQLAQISVCFICYC